MCYNVNFNPIF